MNALYCERQKSIYIRLEAVLGRLFPPPGDSGHIHWKHIEEVLLMAQRAIRLHPDIWKILCELGPLG